MKERFVQIASPTDFLERPQETDEIDYKTQLNKDKKSKADLVMNTAAMANYGGGLLIFGVDGTNLVREAEEFRTCMIRQTGFYLRKTRDGVAIEF